MEAENLRYTIVTGMEDGKLVVPVINLWSDYGRNRIIKRAKVTGIVNHGTKVQILDEAMDDKMYYKVKAPSGTVGWISAYFITDII